MIPGKIVHTVVVGRRNVVLVIFRVGVYGALHGVNWSAVVVLGKLCPAKLSVKVASVIAEGEVFHIPRLHRDKID